MIPRLFTPIHAEGSTLVISLLLLTVMSLLGIGAMQGAQIEQKMAANFRFGSAALYAAESGLQQAIRNHTNDQLSSAFTATVGESRYSTTVTPSEGYYTVVSHATHAASGSSRTLSMVLSGSPGLPPSIEQWIDHE